MPRFERAYYPLTDSWVDVEFALRMRNNGDYRENPCWNSRASFLRGSKNAIRLVPVDNSGNDKVNFFRAWPGDEDKLKEEASELGIDSGSSEYIVCGQRVRNIIDAFILNLRDEPDPVSVELLGVIDVEELESGADCPDIVIHHEGRFRVQFGSESTRLFVRDTQRTPGFEIGLDDWILDVSKVSSDVLKPLDDGGVTIPDWNDIKILVHQYWVRFREGRARALASRLEERQSVLDKEEAKDVLQELGHLSFSDFNAEIKRMLDEEELSSRTVYDMVYEMFQVQMEAEAERIQKDLKSYPMEGFEAELTKMFDRGDILSKELIAMAKKLHERYLKRQADYSSRHAALRSRPLVWDRDSAVKNHRKGLIEQITQNDPSANRMKLEWKWTRELQETLDGARRPPGPPPAASEGG